MAFPATTTRYLLFLCNLMFLVSALAVAVVAIIIGVSFFQHDVFIDKNYLSPPLIILAACAIICFVSFFGCCGVIRESRCCLYMFSALLFVVVTCEVISGVYLYSTKDEIGRNIHAKMQASMSKYNKTWSDVETRSWDVLQHDFRCCGVDSYKEWYTVFGSTKLPDSCCFDLKVGNKCEEKESSKEGCYTRFSQFITTKTLTLAIVVLSVSVVQLLCSVAAGLLARHIKTQYEAV